MVPKVITPILRANPPNVEPGIDAREGDPITAPTAIRVLVRTERNKRTDNLSDIRNVK